MQATDRQWWFASNVSCQWERREAPLPLTVVARQGVLVASHA